jgi:hypothetical protein
MPRQRKQVLAVTVTRNMVDYALQQTSTLCAVALALKDANDDIILPRVTQKDIRYTDRRTGQRVTVPTPPEVSAFIDRFDRRRELVKPFAFDLDLSEAKTRPIKHAQPSQLIRQAELNRQTRERRQAKIPVAIRPKNTSKRELRPVEITGMVD